jgi:hypothetical protein
VRHDTEGGGGSSDGGWNGGAGGVHGTRAEGRGEGKDDRGFGETIELNGKVLKNTRDLAGDLLGVKMRALQTCPT